ncbi:hypothetical protein PRZ48_002362 [Zasmidium cellare]|uniref:mRNA-capping enzyme subunit beta n=1 Tax=Zasmidium cellare TaxID=395010 RepID=A0ABR0F5A1_ZASCE|nr:hypothetical protein PRZ48_002362 [Zasmidium cellare]
MDLAGMLNDGDAPPKRPSQTSPPASSRTTSATQASPPAQQNGGYAPTPGGYAPARPSQQQTPLFGPPSASAGPPGQFQSRGVTPLQTPSAGGGGQYPFPQQPPLQSPATAHPGAQQQQQYRPYEPYSATTPGARPPSHGYAQPSPSLGQYQHALNAAHNASLSPTPPSHPSQTPHAMRQSPLATMGHPPPAPPHHYHQQSQPNTPLGPPQLPQRHSQNQLDMSSPYHQRTYSGTSSGMISGSPAQHHPSIGNLVDSPSAYNRPSPQARRTSDYRSSVDRERSESVSPKTIVQPRPPSLGSRHSSQQEVYSTRGSLPPSAGVAPSAATPGHVQPPTPVHAQPHHSYAASEAAQAYAQSSGSLPGPPVNGNSLSQSDNKPPLQHQSSKMGMSHLLAPTQHAQPQQPPLISNGAPAKASDSYPSQSPSLSQPPPHTSAPPLSHSQQGHVKAEPEAKPEIKSEPPALSTSSSHPDTSATIMAAPEVQPPSIKQSTDDMSTSAAAPSKTPLKRPAESDALVEPAAKRGRVRKYRERPIWAHLSHQNPKAKEPGVVPNDKTTSGLNSQPPPRVTQQNGVSGSQANGTAKARTPQPTQPPQPPNGNQAKIPPWQQHPPLDDDLIHARRVLGPWEKSMRWNVPNPSFNRAVADWLYAQLKANADIGTDPREGTIEIEAKIGTLIDDNGRRCELPVMNACVIHPNAARRFRFESEMNEQEHKFMNMFLNDAIKESGAPGREKMVYEHLYEVDSFRALSKAGLAALPEAVHRRRPDRDLKLRTTNNQKTGEVKARIIKVKLGEDLHIFGAGDPYDIRISMNLEINMDRPDFDPGLMTEEPSETKRAPPNRQKNRMSYKHLAYQVDLTRIDLENMPHKYELELEVNANVLRDQIARLEQRQPHAYTDVVDGFVSNMLMLMKVNRG